MIYRISLRIIWLRTELLLVKGSQELKLKKRSQADVAITTVKTMVRKYKNIYGNICQRSLANLFAIEKSCKLRPRLWIQMILLCGTWWLIECNCKKKSLSQVWSFLLYGCEQRIFSSIIFIQCLWSYNSTNKCIQFGARVALTKHRKTNRFSDFIYLLCFSVYCKILPS